MSSPRRAFAAVVVTGVAGCVLLTALVLALRERGTGTSDITLERIEWPDLGKLQPADRPFRAGEKLTYEFGWNGVSCARFVMELDEKGEGPERRLVFRYHGRTTNALVERLWSYRVEGSTRLDPETLLPERGQRESTERKDKRKRYSVRFDRSRQVAEIVTEKLYKNKREVQRVRFVHGLDTPSAFLMARAIPLGVGEKAVLEVVHDEQIYAAELIAQRNESVEVKAGQFETVVVELRLHALAGDEEEREEEDARYRKIRLWFAEADRLPVKLESEVFVGEVYGELVSVER